MKLIRNKQQSRLKLYHLFSQTSMIAGRLSARYGSLFMGVTQTLA